MTSPATPMSGITAETTNTVPNPDAAAIWPETTDPVMTPKSVNAQNVAIAAPRSAGAARSIARAASEEALLWEGWVRCFLTTDRELAVQSSVELQHLRRGGAQKR
jgi:hypothetical protein